MKHTLLLLGICMSAFFSNAQWTADTTLNTLVRDTAGATTPHIATLSDGKSYISWFEQGTQNYELRMQLLDADGYEVWTHGGIVISAYPQSTALYRYDLKIDNEGN